MAGKKAPVELIGFEDQTGIFYPLAREVKIEGRVKTFPIPPCNQNSFIKKLRSDGVKGKLKPRFRHLRHKRKTPIPRVQEHA